MKTKLNFKNMFLMLVLVGCISLILHDLFILTTTLSQFSLVGITTFILATTIGINIIDYFGEYLENKKASAANRYQK